MMSTVTLERACAAHAQLVAEARRALESVDALRSSVIDEQHP